MWDNFGQQLFSNIIQNGRWKLYLEGLGVTMEVTVGAAILGIVLGAIVAICKIFARDNPKLRPLDMLCDVYITVIRGTPVMVQLLIFAFVIFATISFDYSVYIAILSFGINSGAYVAEIMRAGIQAVGTGQTEAGRSLGLTRSMTMRHIILPQAIRNILPALVNEAISLLKETAIVGYVAMGDVTYMATMIRSRTYSPVPLLLTALIYLAIVMLLTWGMRKLERRLRKGDHR